MAEAPWQRKMREEREENAALARDLKEAFRGVSHPEDEVRPIGGKDLGGGRVLVIYGAPDGKRYRRTLHL